MKRDVHIIDAAGKILGRLAVQIAVLLRGKHKPGFVPNKDAGDFVVVRNIDDIKVSGKKIEQKIYYRHSGYLGGLHQRTMKEMAEKKGWQEILRKAVWGMLPKNRLRSGQIKRLKFR